MALKGFKKNNERSSSGLKGFVSSRDQLTSSRKKVVRAPQRNKVIDTLGRDKINKTLGLGQDKPILSDSALNLGRVFKREDPIDFSIKTETKPYPRDSRAAISTRSNNIDNPEQNLFQSGVAVPASNFVRSVGKAGLTGLRALTEKKSQPNNPFSALGVDYDTSPLDDALTTDRSRRAQENFREQVSTPVNKWAKKAISYLDDKQRQAVETTMDDEEGISSANEVAQLVGSGAVSFASAIGITALTKNPNLAAGFLSSVESSDVYNDAIDAGKSPEEAARSTLKSGVGTFILERIGLETVFGSRANSRLVRAIGGGVGETVTEELQTIYQNLVRKDFDEDQKTFEGLTETGIATFPSAFALSAFTPGPQSQMGQELMTQIDQRRAAGRNEDVEDSLQMVLEDYRDAFFRGTRGPSNIGLSIEDVSESDFNDLRQRAQQANTPEEFVESIDEGRAGIFVDYNPVIRLAERNTGNTTLADFGYDPDTEVTLYRGVPEEGGEQAIRPGDYVASSRMLAESYTGEGNIEEITARVGDFYIDETAFEPSDFEGMSAQEAMESSIEGVYNPYGPITDEQLVEFYNRINTLEEITGQTESGMVDQARERGVDDALEIGNNTFNYGTEQTDENRSAGDGRVSIDTGRTSQQVTQAVREYASSVRSYDPPGRGGSSHEGAIQSYRSEGRDQAARKLTEDFLEVLNTTDIEQSEFGLGAATSRFTDALWEISPRQSFENLSIILERLGVPAIHINSLRELSETLPGRLLDLAGPVDYIEGENYGAITISSDKTWVISLNLEKLKQTQNDVIGHEIYGHLHLAYSRASKQREIISETSQLSKEDIKTIFQETLSRGGDPALPINGYFKLSVRQVVRGLEVVLEENNIKDITYGDVIDVIRDLGYLRGNDYVFPGVDIALENFAQIKNQVKEGLVEKFGENFIPAEIDNFLNRRPAFFANETYTRLIQMVSDQGYENVRSKIASLQEGSVLDQQMQLLENNKENYFEEVSPQNTRNVAFSSDNPQSRSSGDVQYEDIDPQNRSTIERASTGDLKMKIDEYRFLINKRMEALKSDPARELAKYANESRELPEVTGAIKGDVFGRGQKVTSEFAKRGDDIITELGFNSEQEAQKALDKYFAFRDRVESESGRYREYIADIRGELRRRNVITNEMKDKVNYRQRMVRQARDQFGLTDTEIRQVSQRDPRWMSDEEFSDFLNGIKQKAVEVADTRQAKAELMQLIEDRSFQRLKNYRQVEGFPPIKDMSAQQMREFAEALEQYQEGDVFLTKRQLEVVENAIPLKGIKTLREARLRFADQYKALTGKEVNPEDLNELTASAWDKVSFDSELAQKNPFYEFVVRRTQAHIISGEARFLEIQEKANELAKAANKSRNQERGIFGRLRQIIIPKHTEIIEYLEAPQDQKDAYRAQLTEAEMEYAHFIEQYYTGFYEYLIKVKSLEGSRFEEQYFTHTRKRFLEEWTDNGIISAFRSIWTRHQEDRAIAQILEEDTGNILPKSKFFANALFRTGEVDPSENVTRVFLNYVRVAERKRMFDAMIPEIDIYTDSLAPKDLTPKGLEMDRSLKKFINEYINNKKGRRNALGGILKQNGSVDISIKLGNMMVSLLDLGLNIGASAAASVGEQVMTYQALGKRRYAKAWKRRLWDLGIKRQKTAEGKNILKEAEPFVGRNVWTELADPDMGIGDKVMTGLYSVFGQSSVEANKLFLLGSISQQEFENGNLSSDRLAELKLDAGRWRDMGKDVRSIIGSTSFGEMVMKYKQWAYPILNSTIRDLGTIASDLKTGVIDSETRSLEGAKKAVTSKQAGEIYRAIEMTAILLAVGSYVLSEDDDDTFVGKLKARIYREAMTFLGGIDPTLFLSAPRLATFLVQLAGHLKKIATVERYEQNSRWGNEGDLKGLRGLQRQFTPAAVKQFDTPESRSGGGVRDLGGGGSSGGVREIGGGGSQEIREIGGGS